MQSQPRYQPGDKIGGRYQVHQALMGGMGEVYLCLDLETDQPFALKTFQQRFLTNTKLRAAFEEEVAIWVALEKHPNIVCCFFMNFIDNRPFMFLEWIAGEEGKGADLRGWLRRGPLDLQLALDFTIDICRGLIHAQQKQPGLIHRDLKPENILVAQGPLAKITDFGLAQIVETAGLETAEAGGESEGRQRTVGRGGIAGTPAYMAPEQWRGEELDERCDIYAVGCILYEILTGNQPYRMNTLDGLRHQHLGAPIPHLVETRPQFSTIDEILITCLAKRREERFAAVGELLEQLEITYLQQFSESPRGISETDSDGLTIGDYINRGNTYDRLQQHGRALADRNRAVQLEPTDPSVYSSRGITYDALQRHEEALLDHNRALDLDSSIALVYYNRGNSYSHLERYHEAVADYSHAIQLDRDLVLAYYGRGTACAKLERYEEALADVGQAIELDPSFAEAYLLRGQIRSHSQQYLEALADFRRAIELTPFSKDAYRIRGLTYAKLERYQEALADFDKAIEIDPTDTSLFRDRGQTYSDLQRFEEALNDYGCVIKLNPTDAKAFYDRGVVYGKLQQFEKALDDFKKAEEFDPAIAAEANLNIGSIFANQGKWDQAIPYFEQAAELGLLLGGQYAALARKMRDLEPISDVNPLARALTVFQVVDSLDAMQLAAIRFPFMISTEFITALEQVVALQVPPNYRPMFERRLAWLRQVATKSVSLSIETSEAIAAESESHQGNALIALGDGHERMGQMHKAIACYELALESSRKTENRPQQIRALLKLGVIYRRSEANQEATGYLQEALDIARKTDDQDAELNALNELGLIYSTSGEVQQGIRLLKQALEMTGRLDNRHLEGEVLGSLGVACIELSDLQSALEFFERALTIAREIDYHKVEISALSSMASIYVQWNDLSQALTLAKRAAEIAEHTDSSIEPSVRRQITAIEAEIRLQDAMDVSDRAFVSLLKALSVEDVRRAVARFPFMTSSDFISGIELVTRIGQEHQEKTHDLQQPLAWLRQIADEQE